MAMGTPTLQMSMSSRRRQQGVVVDRRLEVQVVYKPVIFAMAVIRRGKKSVPPMVPSANRVANATTGVKAQSVDSEENRNMGDRGQGRARGVTSARSE